VRTDTIHGYMNTTLDDEVILTVAEVAQLLRCKRSSIYNLTPRSCALRQPDSRPAFADGPAASSFERSCMARRAGDPWGHEKSVKTVFGRSMLSAKGELMEILGTRDGYKFTQHDGITILIGPKGGLIAPALRHYDQPLDLNSVKKLFHDQSVNDSQTDPARLEGFTTGHFGPVVGLDWKCGNPSCPCSREEEHRRIERSLGR
jgi:hypothetical protein